MLLLSEKEETKKQRIRNSTADTPNRFHPPTDFNRLNKREEME